MIISITSVLVAACLQSETERSGPIGDRADVIFAIYPIDAAVTEGGGGNCRQSNFRSKLIRNTNLRTFGRGKRYVLYNRVGAKS